MGLSLFIHTHATSPWVHLCLKHLATPDSTCRRLTRAVGHGRSVSRATHAVPCLSRGRECSETIKEYVQGVAPLR